MAAGAAVVRQLRKLVAVVNGSNLALEHYRDIRSLAAGSQIVRPCSSSRPFTRVGTLASIIRQDDWYGLTGHDRGSKQAVQTLLFADGVGGES
jgi:hypothetical protein